MLKRLMNFLLFSTGITPKDHKEPDKYASIRAKRAEWERLQRAKEDAQAGFMASTATGGDDWNPGNGHDHDSAGDGGTGDGGGGGGGGSD